MTNLDGKTLRDLHWEDEGDWLEAETRIGGYVIMPESNELWFETHLFVHPGYFEEKRVMLARGDVDGLKQVANDHHRDQIMWAFSMEVPTDADRLTTLEKEWWQEPGMEAEIDGAAWDLQVLAESLPSRWKHIISAASTLVLCANRRDLEGVDQYLKVIAKQVARPRSSHPADGTMEALEGKKIS